MEVLRSDTPFEKYQFSFFLKSGKKYDPNYKPA
jgi:hypothetical protein